MSASDKAKEEREYNEFISACDYCSSHQVHITSKRIMDYLNGDRVIRVKNDRPDIITKCKWGNSESVVGIEVFYVDQNSKKKSGKYRSKTKESRAIIKGIYERGHSEHLNGEEISDKNKQDLLQKAVETAQDRLNSEYESLICSFKYHFDDHAGKAQAYREEIDRYANGKKIELAFFIEIETFFHDLFLNYNNQTIQYNSRLMPFFSDIVNIIEANPNKRYIDYIVFDLRSRNPDELNVVAIRTGNIKQNLIKQGIKIFEFIGEHILKIIPSTTKIENDEKGDYVVRFRFTPYSQEYSDEVIRMVCKAQLLKKRNIPFVASRTVQAVLYASNAKTIKEGKKLQQEFINKYPFKENDNE